MLQRGPSLAALPLVFASCPHGLMAHERKHKHTRVTLVSQARWRAVLLSCQERDEAGAGGFIDSDDDGDI